MTTQLTAKTVATVLGTDLIEAIGNVDRRISRPAPLTEATAGDELSFCSHATDAGREAVEASSAGTVVCAPAAVPSNPGDKTLLVVDFPRRAFVRVLSTLYAPPRRRGIDASATVDPRAEIHRDAWVAANCVIGMATIGPGSQIHPNVVIYDNTRIGANVTVHAGTVIGADGFGYQVSPEGLEKFVHMGGVVIEDDVEIGSNTSIDRGTLGDTRICEGAKIDNLVHIAHNVVVGSGAAVVAHAMIGGSTKIGDGAWVAPSASLRDVLQIGEGAIVGLGAVVVKDVRPGETVLGSPARPQSEYAASLALLKRLASQD